MNNYSRNCDARHEERGVTMILVALAMVAIIAMAALSIDVVTLYLAREEAQRSADQAALAAARVLSLSGVTSDPANAQGSLAVQPWQAACAAATQVAQAVVKQSTIGRAVANSPTVTFLYNGTATSDCTAGGVFAMNPQVKVDVVQTGLPTFFARIWSRSTSQVSATATAEVFNPSTSLTVSPNGLVTVTPRCVKPWIVPNRDPRNTPALPGPLVVRDTGLIQNGGIQPDPGTGTGAIVGEKFSLVANCQTGNPNCRHGHAMGLIDNPPSAGAATGQGAGTLDYVPALVGGSATAVPSCATGSDFQEAIGGCDQSTVYACGIVGGGAQADLTFNPGKQNGDTATATECLIHQAAAGDFSQQDSLDTTSPNFPFVIHPGANNPLITSGVLTFSDRITSSNSIVAIPIYDDTQGTPNPVPFTVDQPAVTIVGFLQVFINGVEAGGNLNVTVLNVAGCSNTATDTTPTVSGTSPVPVRLITPQ
jgi:Flp pilus assembly protein TadG